MSAAAPLVFVVAAETSGDAIGGRLMAALRRLSGDAIRFEGIGGERMAAEGLRSRVPLSALSLFGVLEVLPQALRILRLVRETAAAIVAARPAAVVTIDSSGFNFRLAARLRALGYRGPLVHYVAPQLWAWWRAGKARALAAHYDRVLALFPFEPTFFAARGVACTFVGHPAMEEGFGRGDGWGFRARHRIPAASPLLVVLPGSRGSEISKLLPVFGETVAALRRRVPDLAVVVPTVAHVADRVAAAAKAWPVPVILLRDAVEKRDAFAAATAALAASGTVTLELALSGTPFVAAYHLNPLTYWLVRRKATVRYVTIVNLLTDREIAPEFLQERCRPALLAAAAVPLLTDETARETQRRAMAAAVAMLAVEGEPPSERAARVVLDLMRGSP